MLVTKRHVDIAIRRAAEARRHIDQTRTLIERLRKSGGETAAAESQLETALPLVQRFEAHVASMQEALNRAAPGGR